MKLLDKANKMIDVNTSKEKEAINIFYILNKSLDAAQNIIVENTIKEHQSHLMIDIPRDACESYEFDRAHEMIEIGKKATKKSLKNLDLIKKRSVRD